VARKGDVLVLRELIQLGADVNRPIAVETTPLLAAAVKLRGYVVLDLIQSGAVVNNANMSGMTAPMQVCRRRHWEMVAGS
jgi:ankyrin repeat protein